MDYGRCDNKDDQIRRLKNQNAALTATVATQQSTLAAQSETIQMLRSQLNGESGHHHNGYNPHPIVDIIKIPVPEHLVNMVSNISMNFSYYDKIAVRTPSTTTTTVVPASTAIVPLDEITRPTRPMSPCRGRRSRSNSRDRLY